MTLDAAEKRRRNNVSVTQSRERETLGFWLWKLPVHKRLVSMALGIETATKDEIEAAAEPLGRFLNEQLMKHVHENVIDCSRSDEIDRTIAKDILQEARSAYGSRKWSGRQA
jgi:hypothetical protein